MTPLDAVMVGILVKYGLEAVVEIIQGFQASGEPTIEQIKQAYLEQRPEDYLKK